MLKNYQLTPLMKALELLRANLFIADDVGLGKTIEAGLVLQELLLRQQADFVLVVCPASVCLQWRDETLRASARAVAIPATQPRLARRRARPGESRNRRRGPTMAARLDCARRVAAATPRLLLDIRWHP